MNKIWTIIKREYKESVYKKSFIIMTILGPVIMLALVFLPALLIGLDTAKPVKITVIDFSGIIYQELVDNLDVELSDGNRKYNFTRLEIPNTETFEVEKGNLREQVLQEKIDGFLTIPAQLDSNIKVEYFAKNVANYEMNREIRQVLNDIIIQQRIVKSGLDPDLVQSLTERIEMRTFKIRKGDVDSERGFGEEYFGTFAFVMILYITILLYGNSMMRGVIQEKSSRVIEVLLSSTNSFQLMLGKIIGLGSVGLTQYLVWSLFGIGLSMYGSSLFSIPADAISFQPMIFVYFVIYFILGYFLFATLYAGVGAMVNNDQEAQQMSAPIVFLIIIPIMMIGFMVKSPDSTLAVTLSMIPFFSPILMFTRINLTTPSLLEIWGSIGLLVLFIILSIWLVAKIYRVGILMYGKKPNLPEIMKWIRAK